jgi:ubiquinol-cytochrome c reductase cytochrome b subunit
MAPLGVAARPGATVWRWLDERLGLRALRYPVPAHANGVLHTLGGMTLVAFVVLAITGIYLAQFYDPNPLNAHSSVAYITSSVAFGAFVRGLHYWAAIVVTLSVGLHLLRVFVSGAYKAPREINWYVGLGLLAVTMGFMFTGTVVKWDQEGAEALAHNLAAGQLLGALGGWFSADFAASVPLLTRVYFAHIMIMPALFVLLIAAHIFLIKVHGMAPLGRADGRDIDPVIDHADKAALYGETMHPFTSHIAKIAGWGLLLTAIAMSLAIAFVPPLGPQPVLGIEITKPPFMYWWLYAAEDFIGLRGLLIIPAVFFGLLALVPILDRGHLRSLGRRRSILLAGVLLVFLLAALTIYTGVTPPVAHTNMH